MSLVSQQARETALARMVFQSPLARLLGVGPSGSHVHHVRHVYHVYQRLFDNTSRRIAESAQPLARWPPILHFHVGSARFQRQIS